MVADKINISEKDVLFFKYASPADVYRALEAYYNQAEKYPTFLFRNYFPDELSETLQLRGEPLIDLALALFGTDVDCLIELFKRGDYDLQKAVLLNKFLFAGMSKAIIDVKDIAFRNSDLTGLLVSNHGFYGNLMSNFIERSAEFEELDFVTWGQSMFVALQNPTINEKTYSLVTEDDYDGWLSHTISKPQHSLVAAILNTPLSAETEHLILALVDGLDRLHHKIPNQNVEVGNEYSVLSTFIEILELWKRSEVETVLGQRLDTLLVTKIPPRDEDAIRWVEGTGDPNLIAGLVAVRNHPSEKELRAQFERDPKTFFRMALRNKIFYVKRSYQPSRLATFLHELLEEYRPLCDEPYEHPEALYEAYGRQFVEENPELYFDPSKVDWYSSKLEVWSAVDDEINLLKLSADATGSNDRAQKDFNRRLAQVLGNISERLSLQGKSAGKKSFWG